MFAAQNTPTSQPTTPATVLSLAATYIAIHGWHQGDYYDDGEKPYPSTCALGAIGMVVYGHVVDCPSLTEYDESAAFTAARHVLHDFLVDIDALPAQTDQEVWEDAETIGDWNDHPNTTATTVIAALHAAATDWNQRQGGAQ